MQSLTQKKAAAVKRIREDPVYFVRDYLGSDPWPNQAKILEAVRDNKEVAVASCHAAGKSWISARAVLWFNYTHKLSRVVTTAPTFDQVKEQVKSLLIRDKYFALVKEARAAAKVDIPDAELKKAIDAADGGAQ